MTDRPAQPAAVTFREAVRVWWLLGINSFGGPAGQIPLTHRMLVEERGWISERRFLQGLNYAMALPGPEAHQLVTYLGWLLHGTRGGLVAGLLFILPGFVIILALTIAYITWGDSWVVEAIFQGVKPAVVAIIVVAVVRLWRRAIIGPAAIAICLASFLAIFLFDVRIPFVILGAALIGWLGGRLLPTLFRPATEHDPPTPAPTSPGDGQESARPLRTLLIGLAVWMAPLVAILTVGGGGTVWSDIGSFFAFAALITFGGAYTVLALVTQQAVVVYGWLLPGEMVDGLGMAESTPGPAILVVQFVGFLGAYRLAGGIDPMVAGILGAVLATWMTFAPSFVGVLVGAPYVERIHDRGTLQPALDAITASVVGVIAHLGVWFALNTMFEALTLHQVGPMRLVAPDWSTFEPLALGLTLVALVLLTRLRWPMVRVLAVCAALGMIVGAVNA